MQCRKCDQTDPECGFEPGRRTCRRCYRDAWNAAQRRRRNTDQFRAAERERVLGKTGPQQRDRRYRKKYGMSYEGFVLMAEEREWKCDICHVAPAPDSIGRRLFVDHDHTTGVVRGLLCRHCNLLLGHARDSEATLLAAIEYLRRDTE